MSKKMLILNYSTVAFILVVWLVIRFHSMNIIENGIRTEGLVTAENPPSRSRYSKTVDNGNVWVMHVIAGVEYESDMDWISCEEGDIIDILYMQEKPEQAYTEQGLAERIKVYDMVCIPSLVIFMLIAILNHMTLRRKKGYYQI